MNPVLSIVQLFFQLYSFAILGRALVSWVQVDPYHPAVRFLLDVTEPVMAPIRNVMPATGIYAFTAIVAMVLVQTAGQMTVALLGMVL